MVFDISITKRCHNLMRQWLQAGDIVVDATAGNGKDTLFLANQVGQEGIVVGFDIQPSALANCYDYLTAAQIPNRIYRQTGIDPKNPGIYLIEADHAELSRWIPCQVKALMYNLGYLPTGDKQITTTAQSSIASIEAGLGLLQHNGYLSIISYPGHSAGEVEHQAVKRLLQQLNSDQFEVLSIIQTNRSAQTPQLHIIKKR